METNNPYNQKLSEDCVNVEMFEANNPQQQGGYPQNQPFSGMQVNSMQGYPSANPMVAQDPNMGVQSFTFAACNQGIANGFGAMFFNIRDPNFTKTNVPVRQKPSLHLAVVIFNLIFIAGLVVGLVGLNSFLSVGATIAIIVSTYLVYLIAGCCCSDIKEYVQNTKRLEEYERTYKQMVQGKGYFNFNIQCYHYVTHHTKNGTQSRKVVTHTAKEIFRPESTDESGEVSSIYEDSNRTFLHYLKRYYFTDDLSQNRFIASFNRFVAMNSRDTHQNYHHTFEIDGFEEYVSFTASGEGSLTRTFFYIFTLLGFAFPYSCIFERSVSRYEVGLLKRLTV